MATPFDDDGGIVIPDAQVAKLPFGYEPITPPGEKVHFRIYDSRDNRIATCYLEEHARFIVDRLNR